MRQKTAQKLLTKVVEDYDNIAGEFDQTRKNKWPEFDSALPYIKDGQIIVDIGCGNGRFFDFIRKKRKVQYLGIDKSEKLIEKAVSSYKGPNAHFTHGDALNLQIENSLADVAVCFAVLHHIPTKDLKSKATKEIHRILKKDGILIISVWNLFQKKYKKYIWKARLKAFFCYGYRDTFIPWGRSGIKRYYYAFKPKELKKLLENNNFKILEETVENNIMLICQKV